MTQLQNNEIKILFDEAYNGKTNFMTSTVLRYGKAKDYIYELSEGPGFQPGKKIYGVTVLNLDGSKTHHLNSCFMNLASAEQFINSLRSNDDEL